MICREKIFVSESTILEKLISKHDAVCLLEIIHKSLYGTSEEDFRDLMANLKQLIPYDFALVGLSCLDRNGLATSHEVINISYPSEWLNLYITREYHKIDPIFKENFNTFNLQHWSETYRLKGAPDDFVSAAEVFRLNDGYTHGIKSAKGNTSSLFSLSGGCVEYTLRTEILLEYVIPHLHHALSRVLSRKQIKKAENISARELEIINWLKYGKSSWDISMILGISERTVNFHISNIMQKLDAVNRPQVVAIAIQSELICLD